MSKNIVFVSHCDFTGNSAMHLFSIANALTDLGHSCAVCVPIRPETVLEHGRPRFQVLDYENAEGHGVSFADGRAPDLISRLDAPGTRSKNDFVADPAIWLSLLCASRGQ